MSDNISNQDIDMSGVNIARPLLSKQTLKCKTGDVVFQNDEKRGRQVIVPLVLEQPGVDTNGAPVHPGFQHTHRILLDAKGKRTEQMVKEELGKFMAAALRLGLTTNLPPFKLSDLSVYSGKDVLVAFDTRPDRQDPNKLFQDVRGFYAVKD